MAKEQESKNPILNLLGDNFSGHIQFDTDEGPVQIHFRSGMIVPTPVTENTVDTKKVKELTPKQILAKQKLDKFIDGLPDLNITKNQKQNEEWMSRWDSDILEYGEDAIIGMFPRETGKNTVFLTRFFNSLSRSSYYPMGIHTKTELFKTPNKSLYFRHGLGEKSIELIRTLKDIIRAENEL